MGIWDAVGYVKMLPGGCFGNQCPPVPEQASWWMVWSARLGASHTQALVCTIYVLVIRRMVRGKRKYINILLCHISCVWALVWWPLEWSLWCLSLSPLSCLTHWWNPYGSYFSNSLFMLIWLLIKSLRVLPPLMLYYIIFLSWVFDNEQLLFLMHASLRITYSVFSYSNCFQ